MRELPVLQQHELERETAQPLPRRDTLCMFGCVNVTNVVGLNLAIAVNAASINASANAIAQQALSSAMPH